VTSLFPSSLHDTNPLCQPPSARLCTVWPHFYFFPFRIFPVDCRKPKKPPLMLPLFCYIYVFVGASNWAIFWPVYRLPPLSTLIPRLSFCPPSHSQMHVLVQVIMGYVTLFSPSSPPIVLHLRLYPVLVGGGKWPPPQIYLSPFLSSVFGLFPLHILRSGVCICPSFSSGLSFGEALLKQGPPFCTPTCFSLL